MLSVKPTTTATLQILSRFMCHRPLTNERMTTEATPIPQVYRGTMIEMHINPSTSGATANVPTLPSMKSSLYRKRREWFPPMPATIDDVPFDGDWALYRAQSTFMYLQLRRTFIGLLSPRWHRWHLYIDGTFKIAP